MYNHKLNQSKVMRSADGTQSIVHQVAGVVSTPALSVQARRTGCSCTHRRGRCRRCKLVVGEDTGAGYRHSELVAGARSRCAECLQVRGTGARNVSRRAEQVRGKFAGAQRRFLCGDVRRHSFDHDLKGVKVFDTS